MAYSVGDYGRFTQMQEATINNQTGDYTLALADGALPTVVELNKASGITLTIPTNASVAFDIGTKIDIYQQGAGQVTVAAAGGVTLVSLGGNVKVTGQHGTARLRKRAADTWVLSGDLAA